MEKSLADLQPKHKYLVGVDSDGTAFDTMRIKHKDVFIPLAIEIWNMQAVKDEYTKIAEYVNLTSNKRGINRFSGLFLAFQYLDEYVKKNNVDFVLPDYSGLETFVEFSSPLSNDTLKSLIIKSNDKFLPQLLEWSERGDKLFGKLADGLQPFDNVSKTLEKIKEKADIVVISSASLSGLKKDWKSGNILQYVVSVAGQEIGNKAQQLKMAASSKYEHVLMIGDALGDYDAAKKNNALFYPIMPNHESESWDLLYNEAFDKFIDNTYEGAYEETLISKLQEILSNKIQ